MHLRLPGPVRPFGEEHADIEMPQTAAPALVHRQAMERYTPASVLVNDANEVVHYSPTAWTFLQIPGGELTHDLLQMVLEPLRTSLRAGLEFVREQNLRAWTSKPLTVHTSHGERHLVLRVEAIRPVDVRQLVLVIFDEFPVRMEARVRTTAEGDAGSMIVAVQEDLERAREGLRAIADGSAADDTAGNAGLRTILDDLQRSQQDVQAVKAELLTLARDNRRRIDELAQLSSDLHHVLESAGIATVILDTDLRIVRFTAPLGDLIGIRLTDIGRPLSELMAALGHTSLIEDARRVLDRTVVVEREIDVYGRVYLARVLPYRTAGRRVDGVAITLIDITARRRAEDDLRRADRRKDEFLAVLAHELRNPLAPLSSGVELLKVAGRDPEVVGKVAPVMARQVRQLVRMVDDLLEVSRISGGRLQLRRAPVLLGDIVRDAVASVRPLVDRAGQELKVSVPDTPIVLEADAARLTQVLTNLLNNATKYTPDGGTIVLTASAQGANAVVTVRDSGHGMPDYVARHVFEMFFRGAEGRQPRDSGLGIGLTIAKQLVEMHGGTLSVASEGLDRGSMFTMSVPLSTEAQVPVTDARMAGDELGGHRVLIVDDNLDAAETLGMQVRTLGGNEVRTALSGEVALQTAPAFQPDIVLLDLGMPEMDGYEVARRIRQEPWGKDVMLVAVTGWGQEEHRQRTKEAGFDRHLTKPADPADIESLLAHSPAPS